MREADDMAELFCVIRRVVGNLNFAAAGADNETPCKLLPPCSGVRAGPETDTANALWHSGCRGSLTGVRSERLGVVGERASHTHPFEITASPLTTKSTVLSLFIFVPYYLSLCSHLQSNVGIDFLGILCLCLPMSPCLWHLRFFSCLGCFSAQV